MATPDSDVDIANLALLELGQDKIDALTDTTNQAVAANEFYDQSRQEVLVMTRPGWNCAKTRRRLQRENSGPLFDYDYKYLLPTDCLRVLYPSDMYGNPVRGDWERRGDYLLINDTDCYLVYIRDLETVSDMSPLLIRAIALQLAVHIAVRLKQSTKLKNDLQKDLAVAIVLAEGTEASERYGADPSSPRKTNKKLWVDEI